MTALLLITHGRVGEAMMAMAIETLGKSPMPVGHLSVGIDDDPSGLLLQAREMVKAFNTDNIIVLTDLFGATPSNVAARLAEEFDNLVMIVGMNVPMLIRLLSYADQDLTVLVAKAIEGGRNGIFEYDTNYGV